MKKMLLFGLLAILALVAYGCQTVQTVPKPIEQTPVQNQTITPSNPCGSKETFFADWMRDYECQPTSAIKVCEAASGNWNLFGDGCGDSCGVKPRICTQAFRAACDCGLTKCFIVIPDSTTGDCVNDPYEPYGSPEAACEATNGSWTGSIREQTCCQYFDETRNSVKYFWAADAKCGVREGVSCTGSCASPTDANLCPSRTTIVAPNSCICPSGLTFGLQGCKEYQPQVNQMMSIAGGWS